MSPSSLDALRTTWQHLSTRNNWALVKDEESFLRHATEELHNLQDIRSPEQRMYMALTRAYSALLYEQLWERSEQAAHEVWLASYRFALRDRFPKDEAEVLAQEVVTIALEKLHTLKSPRSLLFWMPRIYQTVRTRKTKETPDLWAPHPESEGQDDPELTDPTDVAAEIEQLILSQQLFDLIKRYLHNNLEIIALVRCVLRDEYPHDVAHDLGLPSHRIRVAKSRALQRLRADPEFKRLLKELTGKPYLPDVEGDLQ